MRILKVRLKNLNSLVGEWEIDFTSQEYQADALFSITGPTGSGKSTILDAICLALYGKTPRLEKVNASTNEIMSKKTGECFSEVEFSCAKGHYRCHWSHRRAKNRPEGKLQSAKHEIIDVETNKVIEEKLSLVCGVVEDKTGMDFIRFTRSILLAQGEFDTFLKASADERSPILEQITGTEIYSEISIKVHERHRLEEKKLQDIESSIGNIQVMEKDEEIELGLNLERLETKKNIDDTCIKKQVTIVDWLKSITLLENNLIEIELENKHFLVKEESIKNERFKLLTAEKASQLDGDYSQLKTLRSEQSKENVILLSNKKIQPKITKELEQLEELFDVSKKNIKNAKKEQEEKLITIQQAKVYDTQLSEIKIQLSKEKNAVTQINKSRENLKKEQELAKKDLKNNNIKIKKTLTYLQNNKGDETLISSLAGIEEQLKNYIKLIDEGKKASANRDSAKNLAEQKSKVLAELINKYDSFLNSHKKIIDLITENKKQRESLLKGKHLRELVVQKDNLNREISYINKIISLEEERDKLKKDKPCPLCGSTHHPLLEDKIPSLDQKEIALKDVEMLIEKIDKIDDKIKTYEKEEKRSQEQISKLEIEKTKVKTEYQALEREITVKEEVRVKYVTEYKELNNQISAYLKTFKIHNINNIEDTNKALGELKKRASNYTEYQSNKDVFEKKIIGDKANVDNIDNLLKENKTQLLTNIQALESLTVKISAIQLQRDNLGLTYELDKLSEKLSTNVANAEQKNEICQKNRQDKVLEKGNLESSIISLGKSIEQRLRQILENEAVFLASLAQLGFKTENEYLASKLDNETLLELRNLINNHDKTKISLENRTKENRDKLKLEKDKKLSEKSTETENNSLLSLTEDYNLLLEEIGSQKEKIQNNQEAKNLIKKHQSVLDGQRKETSKWKLLYTLIGSADGKKYRNFAQGLTFDIMIDHANKQLVNMNDRYLLARNIHPSKPLDLLVVDNYQAGEERSTQNLSGGESFIISLALALGLSSMASQKMRVDSLFLDEGFGTLDEDSLSTALETLASLRGDDKLIGVISHVPALKERIGNQISVTPSNSGNSKITGPGCKQIN